jgi:hypothetical protein
MAVLSSIMIFLSGSVQAACINLAERFTESPNTEYSRLDPAVPTTPAKTGPVPIPILHLQFICSNSYFKMKAVKTARTGSS